MKFTFIALILTTFLMACSDGSNSPRLEQPEQGSAPQLSLTLSEAPIALSGILADFSADIVYGEGERNVFDIYLPDSVEPTPLVIYIHGGGFRGGDKSNAHNGRADEIREFLQAGVAYASINYYLLSQDPIDDQGVVRSLEDSALALQFMRYYANSLNIDPENIALYGTSAGAGTSLWLGTHDDMSDQQSSDPVLRESTRVNAVGALHTQSTYDIVRWEEVLLPVLQRFEGFLGGTDIINAATTLGARNYLFSFLGVNSADMITSQENQAYRENVDMLALMDAGDAPIFLYNVTPGFDDLVNLLLHHGLHAVAVKAQADQVGLHSVAYVEDDEFGQQDPSDEGVVSFLLRHIR
jgi:para-nitrobenzyl esterase